MNWANFEAGNAKQIDQIVTQYWPSACVTGYNQPPYRWKLGIKVPKNVQISKKK